MRDIADGFRDTTDATAYAAFWGHETEAVQTMAQRPNRHLAALARARPGRNLRDADLLWSRAGRLLIAERLRMNTVRVVTVRVRERVLCNTWWPVAVAARGGVRAEEIEKILALWLNSALGALLLLRARVETEGQWVKFKKPILEALPVLDPTALDAAARRALVEAYGELAAETLLALPAVNEDDVRRRIDVAVTGALGVADDLGKVRKLLSLEPLLMGGRAAPEPEE